MGREVAVKVLPRARATPEYEAAFRREIRMLASLDHENLVRALDAGYDAKVYYLVTEFVPGFDLRKQVRRFGPLDALAAGAVMTQAARGLAYAHDHGVVHRDVKPGNLLVTQNGRVKVLDLGLAGSAFDPETQQVGRVVGTMDYMAPEQIRAPESAGPAADVYALGCTLYFALAGQPPFPGGSRKQKAQRHLGEQPIPLLQLAPRVDPGLARLVEAMMQKATADRIASAHEVIERLRPWTPPTPVPMSRIPMPPGRSSSDDPDQGSSIDHRAPTLDLLGGRERSSGRGRFAVRDEVSGPPPLPPAHSPRVVITPHRTRGKASSRHPALGGPLRQAATVPLAAGAGAWILLAAVQAADRETFGRFLGPIASPLMLGVGAGLLAALGQALAGLRGNSGR
jgi:serine/threonine protein kinase